MDDNSLEPSEPSDRKPVTTQFPCQACGAVLRYLAGTDKLSCAHCGHESRILPIDAPIGEQRYQDALQRLQDQKEAVEPAAVRCQSCAATFSPAPDIEAEACPYCGHGIVTQSTTQRLIKPQALVPFTLTEKASREQLRHWLGSLWFAPSGVKSDAKGAGRLTGVYVPYWTFDAHTESRYSGQRGTAYRTYQRFMARGPQGRSIQRRRAITKIRWSSVRGRVSRRFDNVLVLASHHLPHKLTTDLTPWLQEALVPYQPAYLAGYRCEAYQLDLQSGFAAAKKGIERAVRGDVIRDIGGDAQRVHGVETRYSEVTFKHVLLPVWVASYRHGGKAYRFVVNGQTGEVQGERPYSIAKITIAVILGIVIAGSLALLATMTGFDPSILLATGLPVAP